VDRQPMSHLKNHIHMAYRLSQRSYHYLSRDFLSVGPARNVRHNAVEAGGGPGTDGDSGDHTWNQGLYTNIYTEISDTVFAKSPDLSMHDHSMEVKRVFRERHYIPDRTSFQKERSGETSYDGPEFTVTEDGEIYYPVSGRTLNDLFERQKLLTPESYSADEHQTALLAQEQIVSHLRTGAEVTHVSYFRDNDGQELIRDVYSLRWDGDRGRTRVTNIAPDGRFHSMEGAQSVMRHIFTDHDVVRPEKNVFVFVKPLQSEMDGMRQTASHVAEIIPHEGLKDSGEMIPEPDAGKALGRAAYIMTVMRPEVSDVGVKDVVFEPDRKPIREHADSGIQELPVLPVGRRIIQDTRETLVSVREYLALKQERDMDQPQSKDVHAPPVLKRVFQFIVPGLFEDGKLSTGKIIIGESAQPSRARSMETTVHTGESDIHAHPEKAQPALLPEETLISFAAVAPELDAPVLEVSALAQLLAHFETADAPSLFSLAEIGDVASMQFVGIPHHPEIGAEKTDPGQKITTDTGNPDAVLVLHDMTPFQILTFLIEPEKAVMAQEGEGEPEITSEPISLRETVFTKDSVTYIQTLLTQSEARDMFKYLSSESVALWIVLLASARFLHTAEQQDDQSSGTNEEDSPETIGHADDGKARQDEQRVDAMIIEQERLRDTGHTVSFIFAFTMFILLGKDSPADMSVNGIHEKDLEKIFPPEGGEGGGGADDSGPFIMLSIIWHLAMIRESGFRQSANANNIKKKKSQHTPAPKKSARAFSQSGIIYRSEMRQVLYA
jgi:hypothetical protein